MRRWRDLTADGKRAAFALAIVVSVLVLFTCSRAHAEPGPATYRDDVIRWTRFYLPHTRPSLIAGQVHQESRWNATAHSKVGAMGLLQIMPGTAKDIANACHLAGFTPLNPRTAVQGGICYDARIRKQVAPMATPADLDDVMLRAYNGGPGWVQKEKREAHRIGLDPFRATTLMGLCGRFRPAASCAENLSYPVLIRKWSRLYESWG